MPSLLVSSATLMALLLLAPQEPSKAKTLRAAVPEAPKQREAEKSIRDLYKAEYAKKSPADRDALVRILLSQATRAADDPAAQFILFREAQDIAAQNGSLELAFEAVDGSAAVFDVDGTAMKNAVLTLAAKTAKTPEDLVKVAEGYLVLIDAALAADDFDAADKAASAAAQIVRRGNLPAVTAKVAARQKEVAELKSKYEKVKKALDTLIKDPESPAANLEVGLYCCFVKGDWDTGLPLLAKGSDVALKSVAVKDLAHPTETAARIDLADGWWDLAEKEKNDARQRHLYTRAMQLYEKAFPDVSGLLQTKVQMRIDAYRRKIMIKEGLEITFSPAPVPRGIVVRDNDDGLYQTATAGGKPCLKLTKNTQDFNRYLYLKLSDPWPEAWKTAELEVEYYDDGGGGLNVEYDAAAGPYTGVPKSVMIGGTKTWKTLTNTLSNPAFKGRQNAQADLRVCRSPGGDFYIRRVTLRLSQK
jgi:hypothetical protein